MQGKLKAFSRSRLNVLSKLFIADDSHAKVLWFHVVFFSEYDLLNFLDNVHLFKYYPMKGPEICFNSLNCSNQTYIQVLKFSFLLDQ